MPNRTQKPTTRRAFNQLQEKLKQPKSPHQVQSLIASFHADLTPKEKSAFDKLVEQSRTLAPLRIKWRGEAHYKQLICSEKDPNPILLAQALYPGGYFSFQSALFILGKIRHCPTRIHVAKERNHSTQAPEFELSDELLREQFSKPPRQTSRAATFKTREYFLLEREHQKNLGVQTQWKKIDGQMTELKVADIERVLLDSAISPHNLGPTSHLFELFDQTVAGANLEVLHSRYRSFNCKYPYWQRIGFLLEAASAEKANKWSQMLGQPKYEFYLDKGYNASWQYSPRWKLYYPKLERPSRESLDL